MMKILFKSSKIFVLLNKQSDNQYYVKIEWWDEDKTHLKLYFDYEPTLSEIVERILMEFLQTLKDGSNYRDKLFRFKDSLGLLLKEL